MSSRVLATVLMAAACCLCPALTLALALPADFDILSHYVDNLDVCLRAFSQDSIWKMQPEEFAMRIERVRVRAPPLDKYRYGRPLIH